MGAPHCSGRQSPRELDNHAFSKECAEVAAPLETVRSFSATPRLTRVSAGAPDAPASAVPSVPHVSESVGGSSQCLFTETEHAALFRCLCGNMSLEPCWQAASPSYRAPRSSVCLQYTAHTFWKSFPLKQVLLKVKLHSSAVSLIHLRNSQ